MTETNTTSTHTPTPMPVEAMEKLAQGDPEWAQTTELCLRLNQVVNQLVRLSKQVDSLGRLQLELLKVLGQRVQVVQPKGIKL